MNTFFYKLALLVMFALAVVSGWAAIHMVFDISLWNLLLGILAAFFLFRALELTDRVNNYGPYYKDKEGDNETPQSPVNRSPRPGQTDEDSTDEEES